MNINFKKILQIKILFTLLYLFNSTSMSFKEIMKKLPLEQFIEKSNNSIAIKENLKIQQIQDFNFNNIYKCLEIIEKENINNQKTQLKKEILKKINDSQNQKAKSLEANENKQDIISLEYYEFIDQSMKIINQNNKQYCEKITKFIKKMVKEKFIELNENHQGDGDLYLFSKENELNNLQNEKNEIKFNNNFNDLIKLICIKNALNIINSENYSKILSKDNDQNKNNDQLELSIVIERLLEDSNLENENIKDEYLKNINYQFNLYKLFEEDQNNITIIEYIQYIEFLSIDLEKKLPDSFDFNKMKILNNKINKNLNLKFIKKLENNIKNNNYYNKNDYIVNNNSIVSLIIFYNINQKINLIPFLNKNNLKKKDFLKLNNYLLKKSNLFKTGIILTTAASIFLIKKELF